MRERDQQKYTKFSALEQSFLWRMWSSSFALCWDVLLFTLFPHGTRHHQSPFLLGKLGLLQAPSPSSSFQEEVRSLSTPTAEATLTSGLWTQFLDSQEWEEGWNPGVGREKNKTDIICLGPNIYSGNNVQGQIFPEHWRALKCVTSWTKGIHSPLGTLPSLVQDTLHPCGQFWWGLEL